MYLRYINVKFADLHLLEKNNNSNRLLPRSTILLHTRTRRHTQTHTHAEQTQRTKPSQHNLKDNIT